MQVNVLLLLRDLNCYYGICVYARLLFSFEITFCLFEATHPVQIAIQIQILVHQYVRYTYVSKGLRYSEHFRFFALRPQRRACKLVRLTMLERAIAPRARVSARLG